MDALLDHLDTHGYAVVRDFLSFDMTARLRAHMDALLPSRVTPEQVGNPVQVLRHPIPGAIMAEAVTPRLLELAQLILRTDGLRMLEQVLIRTDPVAQGGGAGGWHVDMAFFPRHYLAVPRQTYFHMVHALNSVAPGGGAFMIVPGSHKKTYAASAAMRTVEELDALRGNPIGVAGVDVKEAIEVLAREGDLIIFNPMCLHSASRNTTQNPRYVYFASFADPSAEHLWDHLRKTNYGPAFSDDLRNNLPPQRRNLLDR